MAKQVTKPQVKVIVKNPVPAIKKMTIVKIPGKKK